MATENLSWSDHALTTLERAGHRKGGARLAVIGLLETQSCALNALEIEEGLKSSGVKVGRASIYRALEQLEELGLLRRLDVSKGTASYERIDPEGHHHHHIVCDECGKVVPFEDPKLELAISAVERSSDFDISGHEVILRGQCANC